MLKTILDFFEETTGLDQTKCMLMTGFLILFGVYILADTIGGALSGDGSSGNKSESQ